MKKLFALLVALLVSASLAQVTVGVNLELSGRFATIGTSTLQGIEAALAESPMADQITLSICDNATTVEGSVACANRFVDEGVVAVLGAISSSMSIPAAEVLQDAGIIMISTSSTNPATTQIGDYIFRMAYTDDFQGKVAARYAFNDLGAQSAIIFRQQDDDYSFGLANFFDEEFQALGGTTQVVDFVANTVDFSAQINDVLGVSADVIYYSGFCAEGATLVPALRAAGFAQQMLGADASDDSQCPVGGGDAFNGYLFTGFGGPEVLSAEAAARATDFKAFFDIQNPDATDFNGFTLAGADSLNVIAQAVSNAGDGASTAEIRDALAAIDSYAGVSGEITYAGTDGTPSDRTIAFFEYVVPADNDQGWDKLSKFGIGTGE
ncbi:MAG: ABC transporter substrate-binding protein [Trueperaceae bacterium]|nr:ABC transporter substrate-binding protein [Trueperaceae bacterium]